MVRLLALPIFALLASCASASVGEGRVILPASAAAAMLNQCSRPAPDAGEATWQPSQNNIDRLEAILPEALAVAPEMRGTGTPNLKKWERQYVGLVRDGRRFLYGNFFPAQPQDSWRNAPMIVCDGGADFFGVEFDIGAGRISHIAFNGSA
ncbi:hypothetical protein [Allosphingosinicella vermicomposti]|uniref:hypothetical protein n=1 Tax=Allosphingosinicella vermicomposti TaxID=614671 RepID=UPI000D0F0924|nr:hypothetical protein [Allosphingosinicella vermicomposti]